MNKALIGIDKSKTFRVYLAITTDLVEEARQIHDTTPLATAGLGRVLTGAGLMGLLLKNSQDKLTLQFKGDGEVKEILATANGAGEVKGYISNPGVELPLKQNGKLDVGGSLGLGTLTVYKDLGLKEPYVGKIDLATGEIGDDLTAYFFLSEQQSTSVALGVKIDRDGSTLSAGGMILQMLPEAPGDLRNAAVDALEAMIKNMKPISDLVEHVTRTGPIASPEVAVDQLMESIFGSMPEEFQVERLEYRDIGWLCDCSQERLEQVLISVGEKSLVEIIEEDGQAELVCHFCRSRYHFDKPHLERLLAEAR